MGWVVCFGVGCFDLSGKLVINILLLIFSSNRPEETCRSMKISRTLKIEVQYCRSDKAEWKFPMDEMQEHRGVMTGSLGQRSGICRSKIMTYSTFD